MPPAEPVRASLRHLWWLGALGLVLLILVFWRVFGTPLGISPATQHDKIASDATNGFDLSNLAVDGELVVKGASSREAIPALVDPPLWQGAEVAEINDHWRRERHHKALVPNDAVIGVEINGDARAFPICVLDWHEVVNCSVGSKRIAVTYCPLTASAAVYQLKDDFVSSEFAASGMLYNSNTLLFDTTADAGQESLYCQLTGKAASGPAVKGGVALERIPTELTLWGDWLARYPDTTVLSVDTGYKREYDADAYGNYYNRGKLRFPAAPVPEDELPLMARCIALPGADSWEVYPHELIFEGCGAGDEWRREGLVFTVLRPTAAALTPEIRVACEEGTPADCVPGLWFALKGMLPNVSIAQ